jgi:acyl transferase domain-containing protein/NAD(P)-dependent dehydrogenase (short-subunit alcohol dehydrogenase family)/acyl carrier protein
MNRESIKKDIAVIGISCKFSKSENTDQLWENLKNGNEIIQFYTDKELINLGMDKKILKDENFIKIKTTLDNSNCFDYPFFNYTQEEANLMDPQIRILHEQVWLALEDSGYNPLKYQNKIGLYLTASDNFNWIAHSLLSESKTIDPFFLSQISNKNFISSLISYNLNLRGPSVFIDTACSSSLTAIHLATRSLLLRECTLAIAGGIEMKTTSDKGYFYKEGMINSKDGHCKTFDVESSGMVESEGGAVVVLKRLEDAIRDHDNIYAIIRSSAVNNDGKRKVGYTAPSIVGQSECIDLAHSIAKTPYNTISFIEAHGTATQLGDAIEIEALNKAFNYDTSYKCAIGSIKTNAGHLGKAAGIAGFIKTVLSLKNKMIVPSLHFKTPNKTINFDGGPFYVNSDLQTWPLKGNLPLRAGVSSFGIGGTNVHVVLEEYIKKSEKQHFSRPFQLVLFSAKSERALNGYGIKLSEFIEKKPFNLADLAYTLKVGRAEFSNKRFIVTENKQDLLRQLRNDSFKQFNLEIKNKDLVFIFPGQGTQYFKMGRQLYLQEVDFRVVMDEGFEILKKHTGIDYSEVIGYKDDLMIDEHLIDETQYTQPLLFLVEFALASVLMKWNIKPSYMIGHSLGEYVAATIAGVFTFEDALKLVIKRSELMSEVQNGSMISINATRTQIQKLRCFNLSIAAVNSENSIVLSGHNDDVEDFMKILDLNKIPFIKLKTSHGFHSFMMDGILDRYEKELETVQLNKPKLSIISNLTSKLILDEEAISPKYWVKHLRETVNFKDGVDFIFKNTNPIIIEVGPGKMGLTLCKQNSQYNSQFPMIQLLKSDKELVDDNQKFTNAIGEIWAQNIAIDWEKYYFWETRTRMSIPTYSFDRYELDFIVDPFRFKEVENNLFREKSIEDWFYTVNWKKNLLLKYGKTEVKHQKYLIFAEETNFVNKLIEKLELEGNSVVQVKKGDNFIEENKQSFVVNPKIPVDFIHLFKCLEEQKIIFEQIVFAWSFKGNDQDTLLCIFEIFNNICRYLIENYSNYKTKITLLGDYKDSFFDEEQDILMMSSMKQLYVCSQENPNIFSCSLDIDKEIFDYNLLVRVIEEFQYNYSNTSVALRYKNRWGKFLDKVAVNEKSTNTYLKKNKRYLIIGGLGRIGKVLSNYLGNKYNTEIIIFGRKELSSENIWDVTLHSKDVNFDLQLVQDLKFLQEQNQIFYYSVDIADYEKLSKAIENVENQRGKIDGVINLAGNLDTRTFKTIENLGREEVFEQFSPKVQGVLNLYTIFKDRTLDFVWILSSLSSILGGLTFGAYSVANGFIDSFINQKKNELQNWFCINLDGFSEGRIEFENLINVFEHTFLIENGPQIIVSLEDPNKFKLKHEVVSSSSDVVDHNLILDRTNLSTNYRTPINLIETQLCFMIESFFGYKGIGVLDDFFEIGGDSLKAMTFIKRINKEYKIEINIQDFYSNSCIQKLSKLVEVELKIIEIQKDSKRDNKIII